jgi:aryl-alcohol dehydrogenase-like predicted oxidoreductase
VNSVALRRNCTPAQVCIAWVLAKGENVVVIPGTTSLKRLEENIASLNVVLQEEDFKDLQGFDALVKGARY